MLDELSNEHWGGDDANEEPCDVIPEPASAAAKPKRKYTKRTPKKPFSFLPELLPPAAPAASAAADAAPLTEEQQIEADTPDPMPVFPKKRLPPNPEVDALMQNMGLDRPFASSSSSSSAPKRRRVVDDDPQTETQLKGVALLQAEQKVAQLQLMFKDELKGFRVKPGPQPLEYVEKVAREMETIVSLGQVDSFIMDSVYQILTMVEGLSARTARANVTGLCELLKSNKEFEKLCKICFIKYRVFAKVPPETQLLFIVSTTAWIAKQRNDGKRQIAEVLNTPLTDEQRARVGSLMGDGPAPSAAAAPPKENPLAGFN